MPFVLLTVAQKVAMKLFDIVFGDGNILPRLENRFHGLGIASNLLLVACLEFLDFQLA